MDTESVRHYEARFFQEAKDFIEGLSLRDTAKVKANITMMQMGCFSSVHIKLLRNVIKELIVKNYRFIFFVNKNSIYFVGAFTKKTQKTPKQEIDKAERIYKNFIKDNIKNK
jgi:phage-related protein